MSGDTLARLEAAGASLRRAPDGSLRLRPTRPLPPDLLAEARTRREELAELVARREEEDAERAAIQAEPEGAGANPERHRAAVAALLVVGLMRPPCWADPASPPPPGAFCARCSHARPGEGGCWWHGPSGWTCWGCYPPPALERANVARRRT